ncbi:MAG: SGNH/GDSL hydrolase family protein [Desulfamplus sp.]|nr:SGNH/GDSL hydrolase family protein [Desulfamplus sp.]
MKKTRSLFVALILFLVTVCHANSMEFKNIVVFGDSLSDSGNFFKVSDGAYPPGACYEGRYSDGPVWFEYLAKDIGVTGLALNYAYIGAQTGNINFDDKRLDESMRPFPGFLDEIKGYLDLAAIAQKYPVTFAMPEDTLFLIWIGGNDFWGITGPEDAEARIKTAALNIQTGLSQLISAGASKFFVMNLPDLGKTPDFNTDAMTSAMASQLAAGYNQALEQVLSGMESAYTNITITRFDSIAMLDDFITNAEAFGFTNTSVGKWNRSDDTIAEGNYIFWAGSHPTTFTHKLLAKKVAAVINCENCKGNMMPSVSTDDLSITVPSATIGDDSYGFTLVPYPNPDQQGYFWTLDMSNPPVKN